MNSKIIKHPHLSKQIIIVRLIFVSTFLFGASMCSEPNAKKIDIKRSHFELSRVQKSVIIDIIPYQGMPVDITDYVYNHLIAIYSDVRLQKPIPLPHSAYYSARGRYRADSLIRQLSAQTPAGHVTVALTSKDISSTKGNFADWGIMGLSYCPGKACVASTHRLDGANLKEQFLKVAIHELGHTQGLGHCPVKTCFMRDAEGKNTTNEEKEFCPRCKKILVKAGWMLK